jgi:predicted tellurium resistance membrane protein TerC
MEWITESEAWIALLTLTFLEIVLGIDNIVFVSILTGRLPEAQRTKGRRIGLLLAMGMRIALLFTISLIMQLTKPLFGVFGHELSGRDLILLGGGLFLMWKSVSEIHHKLEGAEDGHQNGGRAVTFGSVLVQIAILDLVFSLDSVITAVGMAKHIEVMVIAVVVSVGVMLVFVNPICAFVERHPTLVGESWGMHIPKGYVYFAMGFSVFVEALNLKLRKQGKPVNLHGPEDMQ